MTVVLDANVLLRFVDALAPQHPVAVSAVTALRAQGYPLRTIPQSLFEFWVVATRPKANNGLELSIAECERTAAGLLAAFPLLDDRPGLFAEWRSLVAAHACHGKVAHDARYVAALRTHGLAHLLTFNVSDFARFPGLTAWNPNTVSSGVMPSNPS